MNANLLTRALSRLQRDAARAVGVDALTGARIRRRHDLIRLGSAYGGWIVPSEAFDASSVCYCAGAGEDISFDLALIEKYGCEVRTFDPTPRAIQYVSKAAEAVERLQFHPVGLWDTDEVLRFYAPLDPNHVSHSAVNLQNTSRYFEAPCRSLLSLTRELGHSQIDLLKLDVEGAEHRVIESMLRDRIQVRVLCVEFDEAAVRLTPEARTRIRATVSSLAQQGYRLVAQEGRSNYTFCRGEA